MSVLESSDIYNMPERYIETLKIVIGFKVLMIDSYSEVYGFSDCMDSWTSQYMTGCL